MRARTSRLRSLFCGTVDNLRLGGRPSAPDAEPTRRKSGVMRVPARECAPLRPDSAPLGKGRRPRRRTAPRPSWPTAAPRVNPAPMLWLPCHGQGDHWSTYEPGTRLMCRLLPGSLPDGGGRCTRDTDQCERGTCYRSVHQYRLPALDRCLLTDSVSGHGWDSEL